MHKIRYMLFVQEAQGIFTRASRHSQAHDAHRYIVIYCQEILYGAYCLRATGSIDQAHLKAIRVE
jgi:hypothetical protein